MSHDKLYEKKKKIYVFMLKKVHVYSTTRSPSGILSGSLSSKTYRRGAQTPANKWSHIQKCAVIFESYRDYVFVFTAAYSRFLDDKCDFAERFGSYSKMFSD